MDLPVNERPRERFLDMGLKISNSELLAIILKAEVGRKYN